MRTIIPYRRPSVVNLFKERAGDGTALVLERYSMLYNQQYVDGFCFLQRLKTYQVQQ